MGAVALPAWAVWAQGEIGQREVAGRASNPRIMQYRTIANIPLAGDDGGVPWCAIFVNAALASAGVQGSGSGMARSFERSRHFVRLRAPVPGCIMTYWRGSPQSGSGHVKIYVGKQRGQMIAIGANENDSVRISPAATNRLTGYWWPAGVPVPQTSDDRYAGPIGAAAEREV
jgi:uncharacterized protein (TIGR02594 family)